MGAEPYWYFEPFHGDVELALEACQEREFKAGRYYPASSSIEFPPTADSPAPGAKHATIFDAQQDAGEEGTRSILDVESVSLIPDFGVVAPVDEEQLLELYGTVEPTRRMVEQNMDFLEELDRGQAVYILLYEDGEPIEICFAGYSFD